MGLKRHKNASPHKAQIRAKRQVFPSSHPDASDLYQFSMKLRLVHLMFFAALLTIVYAGDEDDPYKDEEPPIKKNPDYVPRHRRPLDLRIRVP
ncbi:hypothetical protein TNCT_64111 [Trichonephila clavata]|uniref:Uncharacterized protein n=1 Tax=Trichonephila clavata TaxID=2740835 RepID=A0A8X6LP19_TRICU|nr:hypothetical protein TNCT_64111 [Trichonephila clavata]